MTLTAGQAERLLAQITELARWNRRHNLVGPGDPVEWIERHTLDSLAAAPDLPAGAGIDVGTGAGFPGIPLAIARPDCRLLLLEPRQKRAAFLMNLVAALALPNVIVEARSLSEGEIAELDFAVTRATWPVSRWLGAGAPLLRRGGRVFAFVSAEVAEVALAEEGRRAGLDLVGLRRYRAGRQPLRALGVFEKR
ncbi:MAG: 16S rRNA (guanine(527)-N(7))-methyltransferase RsmG [Myxococcales bacterium]